jgi:hypothetical protein
MSVRVSAWVWEHSPVEHRGDLLVLLALADHAHDDGSSAYPSVDTLARKARLSRRGTFDALRRLKDCGAITPEGTGPTGTIRYRVNLGPWVQSLHGAVTAPVQFAAPGGAATAPTGVQSPAPEPSKKPSEKNRPAVEPAGSTARGDVRSVFDAWVAATERDPARTKLTADRRRRIEKAIASHGVDDCSAAVRHIGQDAWARGANDRSRRFDDIEHALGSAERIERWRDQQPRQAPNGGRAERDARAREDLAALERLMGARSPSQVHDCDVDAVEEPVA